MAKRDKSLEFEYNPVRLLQVKVTTKAVSVCFAHIEHNQSYAWYRHQKLLVNLNKKRSHTSAICCDLLLRSSEWLNEAILWSNWNERQSVWMENGDGQQYLIQHSTRWRLLLSIIIFSSIQWSQWPQTQSIAPQYVNWFRLSRCQ